MGTLARPLSIQVGQERPTYHLQMVPPTYTPTDGATHLQITDGATHGLIDSGDLRWYFGVVGEVTEAWKGVE